MGKQLPFVSKNNWPIFLMCLLLVLTKKCGESIVVVNAYSNVFIQYIQMYLNIDLLFEQFEYLSQG